MHVLLLRLAFGSTYLPYLWDPIHPPDPTAIRWVEDVVEFEFENEACLVRPTRVVCAMRLGPDAPWRAWEVWEGPPEHAIESVGIGEDMCIIRRTGSVTCASGRMSGVVTRGTYERERISNLDLREWVVFKPGSAEGRERVDSLIEAWGTERGTQILRTMKDSEELPAMTEHWMGQVLSEAAEESLLEAAKTQPWHTLTAEGLERITTSSEPEAAVAGAALAAGLEADLVGFIPSPGVAELLGDLHLAAKSPRDAANAYARACDLAIQAEIPSHALAEKALRAWESADPTFAGYFLNTECAQSRDLAP